MVGLVNSTIKDNNQPDGFEGSGMVSEELIEVPQPCTGLFASLKTINQDMLNMVSPNAVNVSVINCDIAGIYDTIFNAIKIGCGRRFCRGRAGHRGTGKTNPNQDSAGIA